MSPCNGDQETRWLTACMLQPHILLASRCIAYHAELCMPAQPATTFTAASKTEEVATALMTGSFPWDNVVAVPLVGALSGFQVHVCVVYMQVNIIPRFANFTVDVRCRSDDFRQHVVNILQRRIDKICAKRNVTCIITTTHTAEAVRNWVALPALLHCSVRDVIGHACGQKHQYCMALTCI